MVYQGLYRTHAEASSDDEEVNEEIKHSVDEDDSDDESEELPLLNHNYIVNNIVNLAKESDSEDEEEEEDTQLYRYSRVQQVNKEYRESNAETLSNKIYGVESASREENGEVLKGNKSYDDISSEADRNNGRAAEPKFASTVDYAETLNISYGVEVTSEKEPERKIIKKTTPTNLKRQKKPSFNLRSMNIITSYKEGGAGNMGGNISYTVDDEEEETKQNLQTNISYGVDTTTAELQQNISYGVDTTNNNNNNNDEDDENENKKVVAKKKPSKTVKKVKVKSPITTPPTVTGNISYGVDDSNNNQSDTGNISYGVDTTSETSNISYGVDNTSTTTAAASNISYGVDNSSTAGNISYGVDNNEEEEEEEEEEDGKGAQNISYGVDQRSSAIGGTLNQSISDSDPTIHAARSNIIKNITNINNNNNNTSVLGRMKSMAEIRRIKNTRERSAAVFEEDPNIITILNMQNNNSGSNNEGEQGGQSEKKSASHKININKLGTKECHWNTEFQNALDMMEGKEKWKKLAHLARDFVYCSKTYGKIIISEYYLPEEEKTIKSCDAGGIAGGSKYICSNIFFKFALDTDLLAGARESKCLDESKLPPLWMYGGSEGRNDYAAMKSSKNDMIGLMSYYNTKTPGLCFPLMSLIDYRGFRLIAMSILPINKASIKYGSADGGKVVHRDIKTLNKKMKLVAERLNLKPHRTGAKGVKIYGPGDIEGHLGKDDKFYVLDFGRVFPPEAPNPSNSRKIFYCLLRPEFVRAYPEALSSDAFSVWGKIDGKVHNAEVIQATDYLFNTVIPKFAIELSQRESEPEIRLTELLHTHGINCRHLGRVRTAVPPKAEKTKSLILNEVLARTLTSVLRQLLRYEMKKRQIASQEPYRILVLDFFNSLIADNTLFTMNKRDIHQSKQQSGFYKTPLLCEVDSTAYLRNSRFWTRDIKVWVNEKFENALSEEEMNKQFDVREKIDLEKLIIRICLQSGIKLSKRAMAEYRNSRENFKLLNFDLRKVSAKVRHLNVIDEAEGNLLFLEAVSAQGRSGLWEATNQCYARAVSSNTNNPGTYVTWGCILMEQCANIHLEDNNDLMNYERILNSALEKFNAALKIDNKMFLAYFESAFTFIELAVCMQLFRSSDTIAISLWMIAQAQESLNKAFFTETVVTRSLLYPSLIDRTIDIFNNAKKDVKKTSSMKANIQFLKAFYLSHCAICTAPFMPDPNVFLLPAVIIVEYFTSFPESYSKLSKFITSLAGSYLESSFLTHPSSSDGKIIYYLSKANYQRTVTNTNQILPHYLLDKQKDLQSTKDTVILFEKKPNSILCSYINNEEVLIPKDSSLNMIPVITSDPTNDYFRTIGINRILHVLGNDTLTTNIDMAAFYVYNNNIINMPKLLEEDLTSYSFHNSSWLFLLTHTGFHKFLLTHITVRYPKTSNLNASSTESIPKAIRLYGCNYHDIAYKKYDEIKEIIAKVDDGTSTIHEIFEIFTANLDPELINFETRIRQTQAAKYLIVEFIPPSENIKSLVLSSVNLRGHQYYSNERKNIILHSDDMVKLKPKLKSSKDASLPEATPLPQSPLSNPPLNSTEVPPTEETASSTTTTTTDNTPSPPTNDATPEKSTTPANVPNTVPPTPSPRGSPAVTPSSTIPAPSSQEPKPLPSGSFNINNNSEYPIFWSSNKISPRLTISDDRKTIKVIPSSRRFSTNSKFSFRHQDAAEQSHICQAILPFYWNAESQPLLSASSNIPIPCTTPNVNNNVNNNSNNNNNNNSNISNSGNDIPVPNSADSIEEASVPANPIVIWIDATQSHSTINKPIIESAKEKNPSHIFVKLHTFPSAKRWVNTQIDPKNHSKVVMKLIQKRLFRVIVSHTFIGEDGTSPAAMEFISWFKSILPSEEWAQIPLLYYVSSANYVSAVQTLLHPSYSASSSSSSSSSPIYESSKEQNLFVTCNIHLINDFLDFKVDPLTIPWSTPADVVIHKWSKSVPNKQMARSTNASLNSSHSPSSSSSSSSSPIAIPNTSTSPTSSPSSTSPINNLSLSPSTSPIIASSPMSVGSNIPPPLFMPRNIISSSPAAPPMIKSTPQTISSLDFLYYEIKIVSLDKGSVSIGLATRNFGIYNTMPGNVPDSLGYHSEDGLLYCGDTKPYPFQNRFSYPFTEGDIIGCGLNIITNQVFWTKNGKYLGYADQSRSKFASLSDLKLYPTIGFFRGGTVTANFGSENFLFNIRQLFDDVASNSKPKNMNSDQKLSEIFPYHDHLLENCIKENHGNHLLILSALAKYSRSFNILLRSHFRYFRRMRSNSRSTLYLSGDYQPLLSSSPSPSPPTSNNVLSNNSQSTQPTTTITTTNNIFGSLQFSTSCDLATSLSLTYLFFLLSDPPSVNLQNCTKLTDEFFSTVSNPQSIEDINLSGLSNLTDQSALSLADRFVNLQSIHLWPSITERGLLMLSSFNSLTSICFADCVNLKDGVLYQILHAFKNRSIISLNFSNCTDITDKSILKLAKSSYTIYLQSLNIDYCRRISNAAISKIVRACTNLQKLSVAANPSESEITDSTLIEYITSHGPIVRSLNLTRCEKISADSLVTLAKYCPNITYLDISHSKQIQVAGLTAVAHGCHRLTHLDLFNTNINDDIFTLYAKNNPSLSYLSIRRTILNPIVVVECLPFLKNLEVLIMMENNVTDSLLHAISLSLPKLQVLDIQNSPTQISPDHLEYLKEKRPNLKVLYSRSP